MVLLRTTGWIRHGMKLMYNPFSLLFISSRIYFKLSEIQWATFVLLCAGCTTAQLNYNSEGD
ncbi:hypothetical protein ACS0TY_001138 [Phlomoides rotata]